MYVTQEPVVVEEHAVLFPSKESGFTIVASEVAVGAAQVPSPRQNVEEDAPVPLFICDVEIFPLRSENPSCASRYCVPLFLGTWPAVFVAVLNVLREMSKVLFVSV